MRARSLHKSFLYKVIKTKRDAAEYITLSVVRADDMHGGASDFSIEYYRVTGTVGWTAFNIKLEERSLRSLEESMKTLARIGLRKLGYLPSLQDLLELLASKGIEQGIYDPMQTSCQYFVPLRKVIRGDVTKWRDSRGPDSNCIFHVIAKDAAQAARRLKAKFWKARCENKYLRESEEWMDRGRMVMPVASPLKDDEIIPAAELIR